MDRVHFLNKTMKKRNIPLKEADFETALVRDAIEYLGSSENLGRDFGAESELTTREQNSIPVVFKVSKASL